MVEQGAMEEEDKRQARGAEPGLVQGAWVASSVTGADGCPPTSHQYFHFAQKANARLRRTKQVTVAAFRTLCWETTRLEHVAASLRSLNSHFSYEMHISTEIWYKDVDHKELES
jgi:hypothetical protein